MYQLTKPDQDIMFLTEEGFVGSGNFIICEHNTVISSARITSKMLESAKHCQIAFCMIEVYLVLHIKHTDPFPR
jgi:hypothetical protein